MFPGCWGFFSWEPRPPNLRISVSGFVFPSFPWPIRSTSPEPCWMQQCSLLSESILGSSTGHSVPNALRIPGSGAWLLDSNGCRCFSLLLCSCDKTPKTTRGREGLILVMGHRPSSKEACARTQGWNPDAGTEAKISEEGFLVYSMWLTPIAFLYIPGPGPQGCHWLPWSEPSHTN